MKLLKPIGATFIFVIALFISFYIYFFMFFYSKQILPNFNGFLFLSLPILLVFSSGLFLCKEFGIKSSWRKINSIVAGAILLIPITFFCIKMYDNYPKSLFSKEKWLTLVEGRTRIVDDMLQKNKYLRGMSKNEIINLLGLPTDTDDKTEDNIVYYLGPARELLNIDDNEWLYIKFDNNDKVISYNIKRY